MSKKYKIFIRIGVFILILALVCGIIGSPLSVNTGMNSGTLLANSLEKQGIQPVNMPYHGVIRQISHRYDVDYRLIYSIIKKESSFRIDAVSDQGATGLMQVMPVADEDSLDGLTSKDLSVPEDNIQAGVSYFAQMMDLFKDADPQEQIKLALAAYNAGPARVYDAMEIAAYMGENPLRWAAVRNSLPLLSMRYYSLHASVWKEGKPRAGYFGDWRQTVFYVENVMKYYTQYKAQFREYASAEKIRP